MPFALFDKQTRRIDDFVLLFVTFEINVRPFGDWAIVTVRTQAAGKYRGEVGEVTFVLPMYLRIETDVGKLSLRKPH